MAEGVLGESIFKTRVGDGGTISRRLYNLIIGGCLIWGFAVNAVVLLLFEQQILAFMTGTRFGVIALMVGYFVLAIAGITVCFRSQNPAMSFLGYNMVVLPMGVMLTPILASYTSFTIGYAMVMTGIVTLVMMGLAVAFPDFFLSIGRGLFIGLLIAIVVELLCVFIFHANFTIIDYAVAFLFCGYIGYDWARAQKIPSTPDNAIDSACSLYMDIINLFIRILRILGRDR